MSELSEDLLGDYELDELGYAAKSANWVDPTEAKEVLAEIERLRQRVRELEREVDSRLGCPHCGERL